MVAAVSNLSFYTPRRKSYKRSTTRKLTKSELHLQSYLAAFDAMTPAERIHAATLAWMPPRDVVHALLDASLKQRDRVELLMAVFSTTHPGHSLSWESVARVLGLSEPVARGYGRELVDRDRAEIRDGKFCLKPAGYSHPVIAGRFPQVYRLLK